MLLRYRYRLEPNREQCAAFAEMLATFCELYNAALEHRIRAFEKGVSVSCYDQIISLAPTRRALPHVGRWSATAQQRVMRKLDHAYKGFFRRVKRGQKPGFPRFKPCARYNAADFCVGDGLTIRKNGKLRFVGVPGEIKVRWHRSLPSQPKSAILSRKAGKWYVIFAVEVASIQRASPDKIGLDMGLINLIAMSNGETVARPNITQRNACNLRRLRRALSRCKPGSKIRRKRKAAVCKLQAHIAASRRDFLHKESRKIVNRFGLIGVEDLNIKGLASGMLAKQVNDAAWGMLISFISYKAANAGGEVIKVDPRGTSQMCPGCKAITRKTLDQRVHRCNCGYACDRDVVSAQVVHYRAFGLWPGTGRESLSQRNAA